MACLLFLLASRAWHPSFPLPGFLGFLPLIFSWLAASCHSVLSSEISLTERLPWPLRLWLAMHSVVLHRWDVHFHLSPHHYPVWSCEHTCSAVCFLTPPNLNVDSVVTAQSPAFRSTNALYVTDAHCVFVECITAESGCSKSISLTLGFRCGLHELSLNM